MPRPILRSARALLETGDEAGIEHIERAIQKDIKGTPAGCEAIFQFLAGRRRNVEAEKYRVRVRMYQEKMERAREERNTIQQTDRFKSHGVAPDVLIALRRQLALYTDLASAQLVQKVVKHFPEEPSYVLGVIRKRAWHESQDKNLDQYLINRLAQEVRFPGFTYIISLEYGYKPLRKVFEEIRGAEIYRAAT